MAEKQKKQKHDPLDALRKRTGLYMGHGENHEKKAFKGDLELRSVVNNKGVSMKYKAVGMDGVEFNKETNLYNLDTIL